jgi:NAD+ synthase
MQIPKLNAELTERILVRFLREEAGKFGFEQAVLGLSGGIDSAVSAALAARAYGPANVLALLLPYRTSLPSSRAHAELLAEELGIRTELCDLSASADALFAGVPEQDRLRRGNILARLRMIVLYDRSARERALVVGTSNKSEILLGYSTQYGDAACAINPLGDLYKTQVFELAEHLGIPDAIRTKAPSADLWEGQTDEGEMGFRYAELDRLLFAHVDRRYPVERLLAEGFAPRFVEEVLRRMRRNHYKRRPPVVAKLGNRTVEVDFRYVRDWGR